MKFWTRKNRIKELEEKVRTQARTIRTLHTVVRELRRRYENIVKTLPGHPMEGYDNE